MLSVTEVKEILDLVRFVCYEKREQLTSRTAAYNVIKLQVCNNRQMGNALVLIADYNIRINCI
jgi:hypothetical protein